MDILHQVSSITSMYISIYMFFFCIMCFHQCDFYRFFFDRIRIQYEG